MRSSRLSLMLPFLVQSTFLANSSQAKASSPYPPGYIKACDTWVQAQFDGRAFLCETAMSKANVEYLTWLGSNHKKCKALGGRLRKLTPTYFPAFGECTNQGLTTKQSTYSIHNVAWCQCKRKEWSWSIDSCGDKITVKDTQYKDTAKKAERKAKLRVADLMITAQRDCRYVGGTMKWTKPSKQTAVKNKSGTYTYTWSRTGTCDCSKLQKSSLGDGDELICLDEFSEVQADSEIHLSAICEEPYDGHLPEQQAWAQRMGLQLEASYVTTYEGEAQCYAGASEIVEACAGHSDDLGMFAGEFELIEAASSIPVIHIDGPGTPSDGITSEN